MVPYANDTEDSVVDDDDVDVDAGSHEPSVTDVAVGGGDDVVGGGGSPRAAPVGSMQWATHVVFKEPQRQHFQAVVDQFDTFRGWTPLSGYLEYIQEDVLRWINSIPRQYSSESSMKRAFAPIFTLSESEAIAPVFGLKALAMRTAKMVRREWKASRTAVLLDRYDPTAKRPGPKVGFVRPRLPPIVSSGGSPHSVRASPSPHRASVSAATAAGCCDDPPLDDDVREVAVEINACSGEVQRRYETLQRIRLVMDMLGAIESSTDTVAGALARRAATAVQALCDTAQTCGL
jgi:hypothetical protein